MNQTAEWKGVLGYVAAVFLLAYVALDYVQMRPHQRPFTFSREGNATTIHYASDEVRARGSLFATMFFYGCAVGCAITACVYRVSRVGTLLAIITLVLAIVIPIIKWPLFQ